MTWILPVLLQIYLDQKLEFQKLPNHQPVLKLMELQDPQGRDQFWLICRIARSKEQYYLREFCLETSSFLLMFLIGAGSIPLSWKIPALPGAQYKVLHFSDCLNFQQSACSRPPPPTTSRSIYFHSIKSATN